MASKRKIADQIADTRGGRWVGIPHAVVTSDAYRTLTSRAKETLIEIAAEFNGFNNGKIVLSTRQIAERQGHQNYASVCRAIAQLMKHGLIDVAFEGNWKVRLAREYRLTFATTGRAHARVPATNDYLHFTPSSGNTGAEPGSAEAPRSAEVFSAGAVNTAE